MDSFYSKEELEKLGFQKIGEEVLVSRKASIYGAGNMELGSHVRIDDFCFLSGKITIGNYVHISAFTSLVAGDAGIQIGDFSTASSRCMIYAISDDYSGEYMTNPMVMEEYRNVEKKEVIIDKHVIIGTNTTVLPGVHMKEGAAIGAMCLVNKDIEEWTINVGIPCRKIKERSRNLLRLEEEFKKELEIFGAE